MKNRIVAFDTLRFILALFVVFGHTFLSLYRKNPEDVINIQNLAVDGFFILSGFLLALSYSKYQTSDEHPNALFIHSVWNRIKRLAPEYLFALMLWCVIYIKHISASTVFFNILFIAGIDKVPSIVHGAWYVSVLFWVGCIYSALLFYKKKTAVYVFIPLLIFLSFSYMYTKYNSLSLNDYPLIGDVFSAGFLKGFVDMGIGILLFFTCESVKSSDYVFRYKKLSCFMLETIAIITFICCISLEFRAKNQYLIYFSYPIIIAMLYLHKEKLLRFLSWKIWRPLVDSAFMLYLIHNIVIDGVKTYLPYNNYPQITVYVLIMIFAIILGVMCYKIQKWLFEKLKKVLFIHPCSQQD